MSRDYRLYLDDIRDACAKVIRYAQGRNQSQFLSDDKTFDAVVRNLEIIGEAAKHVPHDVQEGYPGVKWRKIAGLRDVVAHDYFGLDEDVLWDVIQNQVPALLAELSKAPTHDQPADD